MWTAMAPKIMGAWNLHALTVDAPLDFFVLCSSITSIIGNPGQANYAAGYAFLDALAYYRRTRGLPALTVNWGMIGEVGPWSRARKPAERLQRLGVRALRVSETLDALDELLAGNAVQVAMAHVDWKVFGRASSHAHPGSPCRLGRRNRCRGRQFDRRLARARRPGSGRGGASVIAGVAIFAIIWRAPWEPRPRVSIPQQSLLSLGLDSLMAVEMRNRLNEDLGINVPLEKFMHGASIKTVASYIAERLLEGGGGERADAAAIRIQTSLEAASDSPLSRAEAADLLERIDELTDVELDQHLSVLAAQG